MSGLRVKWRFPNGKWVTGDWFEPDGTYQEYEGVVQSYLCSDGVPMAVILVGESLEVQPLNDLTVVLENSNA